MSNDKSGDRKEENDRHKGRDSRHKHRGPKTFRRGRAIAFLEMMHLKRSTIKQQLEEPEFQSIHQILLGELKAIDLVINEFVRLFELHESEMLDMKETEDKELDQREKGTNYDETN